MAPRARTLLPVFLRPAAVWRFVRDPRASRVSKVLLGLATLYALFPIDLVPDVVPIFGWLDDVGIAGAVISYVALQVSKHEAARRALAEPQGP